MTWGERLGNTWRVVCLVFPVLLPWLVIAFGIVVAVVMVVACVSSRM